ncbi:MAG: hypothetical protein ACOC1P_04625 [Minisyncoccales bacterium]
MGNEGLIEFLNRKDSEGNVTGYKIFHDGRDDWTAEGIEEHVKGNGHSRITAGVGVNAKYYSECCQLADRLESYNKY